MQSAIQKLANVSLTDKRSKSSLNKIQQSIENDTNLILYNALTFGAAICVQTSRRNNTNDFSEKTIKKAFVKYTCEGILKQCPSLLAHMSQDYEHDTVVRFYFLIRI